MRKVGQIAAGLLILAGVAIAAAAVAAAWKLVMWL